MPLSSLVALPNVGRLAICERPRGNKDLRLSQVACS
jgi:hypothetical protein